MRDQRGRASEPGTVLPLRISQEIAQQAAHDAGVLFPGWLVRVETRPVRWHARRVGDFRPIPGDERAGEVAAGDVGGLVAMLERQVRLDLAAEFPDWAVARAGADGWQAVYRTAPPHRGSDHVVVRVVRHPVIAGLLAALRELAAREAGP